MIKQYFTAIDEQGNIHIPSIEECGGRYSLTFNKETLQGVQKLRVLPMLAKAKVGSEGFFITPRNISMSGDLLVRFVPKEDTSYEYDLSINKYKQTEYKAVEYAPTSVILAELREMEKQIEAGLAELEGML